MKSRLSLTGLPWPQIAEDLGFSAPDAEGVRALNGFALRSKGDWLALVDRGSVSAESLSGELGTPGLWRVLQAGEGFVREHDLPPLACAEAEDDSPLPDAMAELVAWASKTQKGERDPNWTPPSREVVLSWFDSSRLNLRSGSLLAKGELVHEPERLALVFPQLALVPEELSPARSSWLDEFLLDAQRHWSLVRFGIDSETGAVRAEVDLTGVPAAWACPFVQLALEALTWAVVWVLSPLSFLVDTRAHSRALDRYSLHSLKRSTSA
jgi:hypothetical protein